MAINEDVILTQTDVRQERRIANNFDGTKFDSFALQVQRNYLPRLLGDAMYWDMLANINDANYEALLDGASYENREGHTVGYRGLRVYLAFLWLQLYAREGGLSYSEIGASRYQDENSTPATTAVDADTIRNQGKEADMFARQTVAFLEASSDDYPLYVSASAGKGDARAYKWRVRGDRSAGLYSSTRGFDDCDDTGGLEEGLGGDLRPRNGNHFTPR